MRGGRSEHTFKGDTGDDDRSPHLVELRQLKRETADDPMILQGKKGTEPSASKFFHASATCESVDHSFRVDSEPRDFFAEQGYYCLSVVFSSDEKERLDYFMERTIERRGQCIRYLNGHTGHVVSRVHMDSLLPPPLRRAVITQDVQQSLQSYFGDSASPTLFALEVHQVKAGSPEQKAHGDITCDDEMTEAISRLAIICIVSTCGPITTMVYPGTRATQEADDELAEMPCIRATEVKNCLLLDAAMAHKGSANTTGKDDLRLIFTFIRASSSAKQIQWLKRVLSVRTPLNISVAQFLGQADASPQVSMGPPVMHSEIIRLGVGDRPQRPDQDRMVKRNLVPDKPLLKWSTMSAVGVCRELKNLQFVLNDTIFILLTEEERFASVNIPERNSEEWSDLGSDLRKGLATALFIFGHITATEMKDIETGRQDPIYSNAISQDQARLYRKFCLLSHPDKAVLICQENNIENVIDWQATLDYILKGAFQALSAANRIVIAWSDNNENGSQQSESRGR